MKDKYRGFRDKEVSVVSAGVAVPVQGTNVTAGDCRRIGMVNKMLEVAYMSIEGMSEADRELLYSCVTPERQEQLRSRRNSLSADLSLAGEVLARVMLWKTVRMQEEERQAQCDCIPDDYPYSGGRPGVIQPKDFVILRDKQGKPYQETVPGLFFNYSHSGSMVACGVAGENIGVDIQKQTEGSKVREKVYCEEELVDEENSVDWSRYFTEIWTKKESYLKLTGEGLRREMKSLNVRRMRVSGEVQWYGGWVLDDYCLYACVEDFTARKTGRNMYQMGLCEVTRLIKSVQEVSGNAER